MEYSEQELIRKTKLSELREQGFSFPNDSRPSHTSSKIKELERGKSFIEGDGSSQRRYKLSGRIIAMRVMGKASFFHIEDRDGRIQAYVRRDDIGVEKYAVFKKYDLGDIVEFSGFPFKTKTGELTIYVEDLRLLVKCLHPLPEKWHGLEDLEMRYRQRYLDLIVSPEVKGVFRRRSQIIAGIREFFNRLDYLEVETPILSRVASGASAKPFKTYHNALGVDFNMRIALELPLKRLLVGGIDRVYEIGRVFRNEGLSRQHNPEFTMIEFYQAYANFEDLMQLTEDLILELCHKVNGQEQICWGGKNISLKGPWRRVRMLDALVEFGGVDDSIDLLTLRGIVKAAKDAGIEDIATTEDYGKALLELFEALVEEKLHEPIFITHFPVSVSPLSRKNGEDPRFVNRFELYIAGMEVANAFDELNDPEDQCKRFVAQAKMSSEAMEIDNDFIKALEYGMPPAAGEGIGIDRLVMLLTGQSSIRDVIFFPQMRPQR